MTDKPRLIGRAFPLKQASLDSVHDKECAGWRDPDDAGRACAPRVASLGAGRNERFKWDICTHAPNSWAQGEGRP